MISKVLLGFTRHDRTWLTRITLLALVASMIILLCEYYSRYDDSEYSNDQTQGKISTEKIVFKKFYEQQNAKHSLLEDNGDDVILTLSNGREESSYQWPTNILIDSEPFKEHEKNLKGIVKPKTLKPSLHGDFKQTLSDWLDSMSNPNIDVNSKHIVTIFKKQFVFLGFEYKLEDLVSSQNNRYVEFLKVFVYQI